MNELDQALEDITSIRQQVASSTEFRGFGPATLAATGLLTLGAAAAQSHWLPKPAGRIDLYLAIWVVTASVSAALIGVQMVTRSHRIHSGLAEEMIRLAVGHFLPALGTGVLLTLVIYRNAPGSFWMVPGLWQILSGLGIFASSRFLPRSIVSAAAWYLFTGLALIALGDARALSPWAMGLPYGVGQLLIASILFITGRDSRMEGNSDA